MQNERTPCKFVVRVCVTDAISDDTVRYSYIKNKGYVRLHTNKGDLNIELHCDKVFLFFCYDELSIQPIRMMLGTPAPPPALYFRPAV